MRRALSPTIVVIAAIAVLSCDDGQTGTRQYSLTVHVVGPGGVGSLDHRINCTQACDHDPSCHDCSTGDVYDSGQTVPLSAAPDPGHPVTSITGAPCAIDAQECIITIAGDAEVTFTFAP